MIGLGPSRPTFYVILANLSAENFEEPKNSLTNDTES